MTTPTDTETEEIEGLRDDQAASWDDYPIDALLIRNETRTVHDVLRRIEQGAFVMDPDFQRDFIWDTNKQSRLIESVVMRVPLPVFYLAEDGERLVIVDGLQRLSTFQRFVNNKLRLRLESRPDLNRKKFEDLMPKLQNRIEDCNLILYVIDAKAPERTRLDIFERVNSGERLTRQQMRNCLYMGDATRFVKEESRTEAFLKATGHSLEVRSMRDREFVNRFCAFQILDIKEYRNMDDFLASGLKTMNDQPEILSGLSSEFKTALDNNYYLFGKHAFRRHTPGKRMPSVLNASLWDVMSTGLSRYPKEIVEEKADTIREAFYRLMENKDFVEAITLGPNSANQVEHRFDMAQKMFKEVFDA